MREGKNIFERNSEKNKVHSASAQELIPTWWLIFLTTILSLLLLLLFFLICKTTKKAWSTNGAGDWNLLSFFGILAFEILFSLTGSCFDVESKTIKKNRKWTKYQKSQALFRKQSIGEQLCQVWALQNKTKKNFQLPVLENDYQEGVKNIVWETANVIQFFFRKPMQLSNFDGILLPPDVTEFFTQLKFSPV